MIDFVGEFQKYLLSAANKITKCFFIFLVTWKTPQNSLPISIIQQQTCLINKNSVQTVMKIVLEILPPLQELKVKIGRYLLDSIFLPSLGFNQRAQDWEKIAKLFLTTILTVKTLIQVKITHRFSSCPHFLLFFCIIIIKVIFVYALAPQAIFIDTVDLVYCTVYFHEKKLERKC